MTSVLDEGLKILPLRVCLADTRASKSLFLIMTQNSYWGGSRGGREMPVRPKRE